LIWVGADAQERAELVETTTLTIIYYKDIDKH